MAVFKCKMCGGELDVREGMSVAECPYCGTKQTLPRLDDEKKANLYDRADYFRRNNEYDKAADLYEKILLEDKTDAEAYWSLVLCKYGVEYVEDPTSHKRVPTINRTQYTSVFLDEDYQKAILYADGYQKDIYEEEAKVFDDIQKNILNISNKEEPFDIFICYKETDELGNRTQDSVYAQDLYDNLIKEGYKVFFSRITLEDKLGTAYEPYIFAALNSAKVMIVIGIDEKNFNAVWVKNEWSRYLALIKKGEDKTIIPVYKDMNPYDLPEEFAYLQAQDMGNVGFMQDLIRNVKKIISDETISERQQKSTSSVIVATMERRATDALAKGEWDTADRCFDNVLDYDSQNVSAYLGKLMVYCKINKIDMLSTYENPLEDIKYYKTLMDLADDELKEKLELSNKTIVNRIAKKKKKKKAIATSTVITILAVVAISLSYVFYFRPVSIYNHAVELRKNGDYDTAIETFELLGSFKDTEYQLDETIFEVCQNLINNEKYEEALDTLSKLKSDGKNNFIYQIAIQLYNKKEYEFSLLAFNKIAEKYKDIDDYKSKLINIVNNDNNEESYNLAVSYLKNGEYKDAIDIFEKLGEYKDSQDKLIEAKYSYCQGYFNNEYNCFSDTTGTYLKELSNINYKDSKTLYEDYLKTEIELIFNESPVDEINNSSIVSNPFIMHFRISSNIEDDLNKTYKCKIIYPDGSEDTNEISKDMYLTITSPSGELKAEIYDSNGNLLESKTVTVV